MVSYRFSKKRESLAFSPLIYFSLNVLLSVNKDIYFSSPFTPCPITMHIMPRTILSNLICNLRDLILSSDFLPPCDIICWNQVTDVGLCICLDFGDIILNRKKIFSHYLGHKLLRSTATVGISASLQLTLCLLYESC